MKDNNHIDKIFTTALDHLHETAPPAVWESLSNELDKQQAAHFREKYYRLKRWSVAAALFVFATAACMFYFNHASKKSSLFARHNAAAPFNGDNGKVQDVSASNKSIKENSATGIDQKIKTTSPDENVKASPAPVVSITTKEKKTIKDGAPATEIRQQSVAVSAAKNVKIASPPGSVISSDKNESNNEKNGGKDKPAFGTLLKQKSMLSAADIKSGKKSHYHTDKRRENLLQYTNAASYITTSGRDVTSNQKNKTTTNKNYTSGDINTNQVNKANAIEPQLIAAYPNNSLLVFQPWQTFSNHHSVPLSDSVMLYAKQQQAAITAKKKAALADRFSLTVVAAPNHSFTRLENDSRFSRPGLNKDEARKAEQQARSYSAGLLLNYSLNRKWFIQSGIVYSSTKTNIAPKTIYAQPDNNGHLQYELNCSSGYSFVTPKNGAPPSNGDSIRIRPSSLTISYFSVPLTLNYVWKAGKFLLKPGAGLSLNFLARGQSSTNFSMPGGDQKENAHISGLKNSYTDASFGFGIEYMLSKRIAVGIKPSMRLALGSINKDTPIRTYQNYRSLEAGLRINL